MSAASNKSSPNSGKTTEIQYCAVNDRNFSFEPPGKRFRHKRVNRKVQQTVTTT